jgi:hypothetical protein
MTYYYSRRLQQDVNLALAGEEALETGVASLHRTVQQLVATSHEMAMVIDILMSELAKTGLDVPAIHARVADELMAQRAQGPTATCVRCGKVVASRLTNITAAGTVCDACSEVTP